MLYEISNPSDPYTLDSDDYEAACFAVLMLGNGLYGMDPEKPGEPGMGIFIFGGSENWWKETFGYPLEETPARIGWERIAAAWESVFIGSVSQRRDHLEAAKYITDPANLEAFHAQYIDRHRSSMNNIGGRARAMAKSARAKALEAMATTVE